MNRVTVYGIANCDTVKRARAWLVDHGVDATFHDFKKAGVPIDDLEAWMAAVGWERLLNRQGTTWRKLDDGVRATVHDHATARALMLAQPSVIRRPVVRWPDGRLTVGFDADDWVRRVG
jgi:Spx/MgsR family transcriptional regulator